MVKIHKFFSEQYENLGNSNCKVDLYLYVGSVYYYYYIIHPILIPRGFLYSAMCAFMYLLSGILHLCIEVLRLPCLCMGLILYLQYDVEPSDKSRSAFTSQTWWCNHTSAIKGQKDNLKTWPQIMSICSRPYSDWWLTFYSGELSEKQ